LLNTIERLHANGIRVSLFIDPDEKQIDCATGLKVEMIELHTGKLANAFTEKVEAQELDRLCQCARHAHDSKLQVNAGHGINYRNIALIHRIPHLTELNIGHAIVSRAILRPGSRPRKQCRKRSVLALEKRWVGAISTCIRKKAANRFWYYTAEPRRSRKSVR